MLICAIVLALAAMSVCARTGAVLARAGVLVGLTPLAMFLAGTVNHPSGPEVAGAVCGWTGVLLLARDPVNRAVRLWATCAGLGLSMMVLARPASYLWLIPVGVVAAILLDRAKWRILLRRRAVWIAVAAVVLSTVAQLLWARIARTSDVELAGGADRTLRQGLVSAVSEVGGWWYQQVGVLGYLDTPPTASVVAATAASAIGLVLLALACTRGRERLALLAAVLAALLVPMAGATALYPSVGLVWQGRYILPLTVGAIVLAGILLGRLAGFRPADPGQRGPMDCRVVGLRRHRDDVFTTCSGMPSAIRPATCSPSRVPSGHRHCRSCCAYSSRQSVHRHGGVSVATVRIPGAGGSGRS